MATKIHRITFVFFLMTLFLFVSCSELKGIFTGGALSSRSATKNTRVKGSEKRFDETKSQEGSRGVITTKQGAYYFVQPGDTLADVERKLKLDWEAIAQINSIQNNQLYVGQRVFAPHRKNLEKYGVIYREIKKSKKQKAKKKKKRIAKSNKKLDLLWPVPGAKLTSRFGMRRGRPHNGIDLSAKRGTPIVAAEDGKVIFAKWMSGYGRLVVIKHTADLHTAYAHCTKIYVRKGQRVKRGKKIGTVGSTGRATGPHLHFELHRNTTAVDPLKYMKAP